VHNQIGGAFGARALSNDTVSKLLDFAAP
jgi:hypothetical protein